MASVASGHGTSSYLHSAKAGKIHADLILIESVGAALLPVV